MSGYDTYCLTLTCYRLTVRTPEVEKHKPYFSPIPARIANEQSQNGLVAASPSLSIRTPFQRQRNFSVLDPNPLIKLILDGLVAKVHIFT